MTEQYTQKISAKPKECRKIFKTAAVASAAACIVFVLLSAFISMYFMIPFCVFLILGAAAMQIDGLAAKEFEYDFNSVRLIIARKNKFGQTKRLAEILMPSVTGFVKSDEKSECSFIAVGETETAYKIYFTVGGTEKSLLFSPDEYLRGLIKELLSVPDEEE